MVPLNYKNILEQSCLLAFFVLIAAVAPNYAAERTEEKILKLLPADSQIAEVPAAVHHSKNSAGMVQVKREFKKGIINADLTDDGKEEVVVAYYTPPHDYIINGNARENFFERAHVAIFEVTEDGFIKSWERQGWGHVFWSSIDKSDAIETEYPWYIFGARDINGDGILELVFSRAGYGAMGRKVEIWAWDGDKYVKRLKTAGNLHFSTKNKLAITSVSYHAGERSTANYLYNWNSGRYEFVSSCEDVSPGDRAGE